jgi:hypothetical protein
MSEVVLMKMLDLAFTAFSAGLNREELKAEARKRLDSGEDLTQIADWLQQKNVDSEMRLKAAIDQAKEEGR